jgi:diguanylate cyclase (GGDEF)-like protein/PAS domain S-box-containing protein
MPGRLIIARLTKAKLYYLVPGLVVAASVYFLTGTSFLDDVKSDVEHQLTLCRQLKQSLPSEEASKNADRLQLQTLAADVDVSLAYLRRDARVLTHDPLTDSKGIASEIDRLDQFWKQVRPLVAAAKAQGSQIRQLKDHADRIDTTLNRIEMQRWFWIILIGILSALLWTAGKRLLRTRLAAPMTELQKDVDRLVQEVGCAEQRINDVSAVVPAGLLVAGTDLIVRSVNRACREMLDLGPGEVRGKGINEVLPGLELRQKAVETLLSGVPERDLELTVPRGVGAKAQVRVSLARSLCSNGEACLIVAMEDMQLRDAELESRQRYDNLFDRTTDGIVVLDEHGLIADFNPAAQRIFGYSRDEAVGKSASSIVSRVANPAKALGIVVKAEAQTKGGDSFPSEWNWYQLRSGSRTLLAANVRDLSVHQRVEFLEHDCLRVLEMVTNSKPLKAILSQLTSLVERQDPGLMCAVCVMRDGRLYYEAAPSLPADFLKEIEGLPMGPKQCSCGTAAYMRKTVTVSDISTDPLWEQHRHLGSAHNIHASWSSPIFSGLGTVIGSFAMFRREPGEPDAGQLDLLEMASRLAAVAVGQWSLTDKLVHQAHYDALTRLPNRVLFEERLKEAIEHAGRKGHPMAMLYVDLDRFKLVNDTLGHGMGDLLLSHVTERLQGPLRRGDTLARMGGDEFCVILREVSDVETAAAVAHRLLDVLQPPFNLDGYELFISASVGISMFPRDGRDGATLMRNADSAMYRAKDLGKNGFQLFAPEMSVGAREKLDVESSLHRALERDEMSLYYQPQYDVGSGRMVGLESLIRWQHPKLGVVLPGRFIPSAEESGLIVPIGDWVLRQASLQHRRWQKSGHAPMTVAVNVSARQFEHPQFVASLASVLAHSGLDPRLLELELTETMVLRDVDKVVPRLKEVRELGVRIAIDDFGTGYSSLQYLQRLPFDTLKLDKSFVNEIKTGSSATPLIESIVGMTHNLGMHVTAEGVETEAQLETLRRIGCDRVQGFLLSRPLTAESAELLFGGQTSLERLNEVVSPVVAARAGLLQQNLQPEW